MELLIELKRTLIPILSRHGFRIIKSASRSVQFQSSNMKFNVFINDRENSNFAEVGKLNDVLFPINDRVMKFYFGSDLMIEYVQLDEFIENLAAVFQERIGSEILDGEILGISEFMKNESAEYMSSLFRSSVWQDADMAWENSDFKRFILIVDQIGFQSSPRSVQLRYKIAENNLRSTNE